MPRYAAEQSNRFHLGHDRRTPEERRRGKRWVKATPTFGERILVKLAGKGRKGDLTRGGGKICGHNRYGSVGMTKDGVVVGTSYHS